MCWLSPATPQEGTVYSAPVFGVKLLVGWSCSVFSILKPQGPATQQALDENLVGGRAGKKAVPQHTSYTDSSLNSTGQELH